MVKCPDGHDSVSEDFCDVCGILIGGAPSASAAPAGGPGSAAGQPGDSCPACGTPKTGQFCEACGYNFATAQPSAAFTSPPAPDPFAFSRPPAPMAPSAPPFPSVPLASGALPVSVVPSAPDPVATAAMGAPWTVVVAADRDYYEVMRAASDPDGEQIPFPSYCPDRRFMLTGQEMRIGRRSPSRGLEPEIDLTGPPADPGVSRLHAVLMCAPDGSWAVLDPGSANGTQVNGSEIEVGEQIPLHDGDRISIGAWTTITVHSA